MKCAKCGKSPADVHLTEVRNGTPVEMRLCTTCAPSSKAMECGHLRDDQIFKASAAIRKMIRKGKDRPYSCR